MSQYLGVVQQLGSKWNMHISNVCNKTNRTLGFSSGKLCFLVPQYVNKQLIRAFSSFKSMVWDPHCVCLNEGLEKVQKRAARFVTRNYNFITGSVTVIIGKMKWETLQKMRNNEKEAISNAY